jgi:hypothetical protein
VDQRPFTDRQDDGIEEVEVKGTQAMSMSWPEEAEDSWLEEVGNPYHSMVAAAVTERVVAAAFCYPDDYWLHPLSRPARRLIRRMRGQARWDDRLPGLGSRQSVVALTERSLLVFEYRIARDGGGLGPCLGRWERDEILVEGCRTELTQSSMNGQTDMWQTDHFDVLQLTASTPDGPLALDLPATDQPGIKDFEQALRSQGPGELDE